MFATGLARVLSDMLERQREVERIAFYSSMNARFQTLNVASITTPTSSRQFENLNQMLKNSGALSRSRLNMPSYAISHTNTVKKPSTFGISSTKHLAQGCMHR